MLSIPWVYSAIFASKPELFTTGALLLGVTLLEESNHKKSRHTLILLSAFILSWALLFKFQPLPIIGLVFLQQVYLRKLTVIKYFLLTIPFWFLITLLTLPSLSVGLQWFKTLITSLNHFSTIAIFSFENIFAFIVAVFPSSREFVFSHLSYAYIAFALILVGLLIYSLRLKKDLSFPVILGTGYILLCSPLQQNNAYILASPLLYPLSKMLILSYQQRSLLTLSLLVFLYWGITFSYSSLTPEALNTFLRDVHLKPFFTLLTFAWIVKYELFNRPSKYNSTDLIDRAHPPTTESALQ